MFEMEVKQNCYNCYWWGDVVLQSKHGRTIKGLCQCYDKETYKNSSCPRWRNKDNYHETRKRTH